MSSLAPLRVVLVTGLSGAGKQSMLRVLEDLGYETVDNPPLTMIEEMVTRGERRLAVGVDARTRGFDAERVLDALARLRANSALRPELFMKAQAHKVVGPGGMVRVRSDAQWSVPEPELVLVVDPSGRIAGYTIGNDMSSRDIEGENPLYLPQAKIYDGSCAIGPGILVAREPLAAHTRITLRIERGATAAFAGETTLAQMKRRPQELAEWLYREQTFPTGCFLFTGTGIVPPDSFTLEKGDVIRIGIDRIGVLVNRVA